jgi:hypothetical protein
MNPNKRKLKRKADGIFRLDSGSQFGEFLSAARESRIQFAAIGVHSRFNCIVPAKKDSEVSDPGYNRPQLQSGPFFSFAPVA